MQGLAAAVDLDGGPLVAGHRGDDEQLGEPVAFDPGAASPAGAGRRRGIQGGVAAQPRGHGDPLGQPLERFADVGGVADQVDGAVAEMATDQVEQLAGQDEGGVVGVAGDPQPRQDRQAYRPGDKRQVDDDADHHPAVAPGGPVAAGAVAVVVPGSAVQLWAAAAPQRVVDRQPDRRTGREQGGADQVQQHQPDLVSRPAGGGKEPVGQVVVAPSGQARPGQHAGDGALARLGQEPGHQRLEGPEGRLGEAGAERDEQVGQRAR